MAKLDVCVVGEINLDIILYGLPTQLILDREHLANRAAFTLGSSSAICAHNLAAFGTKVGFVSQIGKDPLGRMALDRLAAGGVEVTGVSQSPAGTLTGLTVVLPGARQRYILTYPGTMFEMSYSDLDMDYILSARHLHVSSFFLQRALRPDLPKLFRTAKEAGLSTSLDTNDDPEDKWESELLEVLKYVDIVMPNGREARKMAHTDDLDQAINLLASRAKIVAVKSGSSESICRSGDQQWSLRPPLMQPVDDVGAGDSFDSGFLHMFLRGANLENCLAFANLSGAYSTTREGGTEAFVDRESMKKFFHHHWDAAGRGPLPITD